MTSEWEFERKLMAKVTELMGGYPPEANAWPVRQLILDAWSRGYELIKKDERTANAYTVPSRSQLNG